MFEIDGPRRGVSAHGYGALESSFWKDANPLPEKCIELSELVLSVRWNIRPASMAARESRGCR